MSGAAVIDITPEEAPTVALALPDNARAIKVTDNTSRAAANDFFLRCRDARKVIAAHYDPKIEKWKEAKKLADTNRAALVAEKDAAEAPIREAEGIVTKEILRFDAEETERREREYREAEEKAKREAEEAALAAAVDAEEAGAPPEEVAAIVAAPVFVPVVPPQAAPKLAGTAKKENWKFEVNDFPALLRAVAAGKVPSAALMPNEVFIGAQVRASKGTIQYPGVRVWPDRGLRPTGR